MHIIIYAAILLHHRNDARRGTFAGVWGKTIEQSFLGDGERSHDLAHNILGTSKLYFCVAVYVHELCAYIAMYRSYAGDAVAQRRHCDEGKKKKSEPKPFDKHRAAEFALCA